MPITETTLGEYVTAPDRDAYVTTCLAEAKAMVSHLIGTTTVPDEVRDRAVLETGATLYYRRTTKLGVISVNEVEAQPVRAANDPNKVAKTILADYLIGIA